MVGWRRPALQQRDQALINPSLGYPERIDWSGRTREPLMRFGQTTIADKSYTALVRF